jgi:SAM-dependent methyltransferase
MRKCIVCGGSLFVEPLMTFDNMPASAQNIPTQSEIQNEHGINLELYQCKACGLVQFDCEPVQYYRDVIRAGGFTSIMVDIRKKQYAEFIEVFNLTGKNIIEVGAGRGEFLAVLTEFNVNAFGIEHAKELVEIGVQKGLNIVEGFVDRPDYVIPNGPFDAFLSFNFLEHQPNPNGMLQGIYNNLTEDGVGLVTVPSFEYILKYDGFYEFIRDHIVYFTEDSLKFLLLKNGFEVVDCKMINRDTLSALVKKRTKLNVSSLHENFIRLKSELNKYIDSYIGNNKKVAIWGASHQGFTITSTTDIASKISYIIDSAPFKQNKCAPASHVPIVSPEYYFQNPVDCIIIVAPGYTKEILSVIKQRYRAGIDIAILKSNQLEFPDE